MQTSSDSRLPSNRKHTQESSSNRDPHDKRTRDHSPTSRKGHSNDRTLALVPSYRDRLSIIFSSFCRAIVSTKTLIFRKISILFSAPYLYNENKEPSGKGLNYDFYTGNVAIFIDAKYLDIKNLLTYLDGNYLTLEETNNYIKWLFPTKTNCKDDAAQPLNEKEIKFMQNEREVAINYKRALNIMLSFWGMEIAFHGFNSIHIERSNEWDECKNNLINNPHNFIRITRFIKSLECFGMSKYQEPLVTFLITEVFETKSLVSAKHSLLKHWIKAISHEFIKDILWNRCQTYKPKV